MCKRELSHPVHQTRRLTTPHGKVKMRMAALDAMKLASNLKHRRLSLVQVNRLAMLCYEQLHQVRK